MKISLCITTYNKPFQLGKVLTQIGQSKYLPDEVIVCDDGSGPETREMIARKIGDYPVPLIHLWQPDEGWRVSRARNMGIQRSSGDYIIFIDGDCIPHPAFIRDHRRLAEKGVVVLGDRVHVKTAFVESFEPTYLGILRGILQKRLRKRSLAIRNPFERPERFSFNKVTAARLAEVAIGCNMAFWREDVIEINGFNEAFCNWGLEDIELTARLLLNGKEAKKVRRRALVFHLDHDGKPFDGREVMKPVCAVFENKTAWVEKGLSMHSPCARP